MAETPTVTRQMLSAPLPDIIERLGIAVADAQHALDANSVKTAIAMADETVTIGGETRNLLELGFSPTFYTFTEATVEAKLSFSLTETTELGVKGGASVNAGIFAASIDVSYSRKFSVSADGMSSIAARLVSLPPPETLEKLLRKIASNP